MSNRCPIPVIDVFAGPGGLGEGFASLREARGEVVFDIRLSIETDEFAHRTLVLRSFFRKFGDGRAPPPYYEYLRGERTQGDPALDELLDRFPRESKAARNEAWRATLGKTPQHEISERIEEALGPRRRRGPWVLIGGPPCQAYSLAGCSRMLPTLYLTLRLRGLDPPKTITAALKTYRPTGQLPPLPEPVAADG